MAAPLGGTALPDVFVPPPGTPQQAEGWEVVLLVDQRETRTDRGSAISFARLLQGARAESRQLPLGDMVWIARPRSGSVPRRAGDNEHVLSYVVERKRMQDLAASVFDGRYAEQKRRLRESGIARVLYLVEGRYSDTERIEASRLISACANTQVKTGFFVLHTRSEDETADVLAALHKEIERQFAQHLANGVAAARRGGSGSDPTHGYGLSFQAYRTRGARSQARTARQVLATMLRQVQQISEERAAALAQRFGSLTSLLRALDKAGPPGSGERTKYLSSLRVGRQLNPLGNTVAQNIVDALDFRGSAEAVAAIPSAGDAEGEGAAARVSSSSVSSRSRGRGRGGRGRGRRGPP